MVARLPRPSSSEGTVGTLRCATALQLLRHHQSLTPAASRRYQDDIELQDAIHTAILTLKEGFEGQMTEENIEVGVVGEDRVFHTLSTAELRDLISTIQ